MGPSRNVEITQKNARSIIEGCVGAEAAPCIIIETVKTRQNQKQTAKKLRPMPGIDPGSRGVERVFLLQVHCNHIKEIDARVPKFHEAVYLPGRRGHAKLGTALR